MRNSTLISALFLVSIAVLAGNASADCGLDPIWVDTYGAGDEFFTAIHATPDGGFIVGGSTRTYGAGDNDFWLLRLDGDGDTLWTRTYGTAEEQDLHDARIAPAGGYIMCGTTKPDDEAPSDIWVVRADENGDTLWTWTHGDSAESEWAASVQPMANGHFAVAATSNENSIDSHTDAAIFLLDAGGNNYDSEFFGGLDNEVAMSIRQTPDDGFIIAGWTESYGAGPDDVYLVKLDETANLEWQKFYGGSGADEGRDVIVTSDGGYVVVGNTSSYGAGSLDMYIIKTNASGDTLWTRTVGGTEPDLADAVMEDDDGTLVAVGNTESFGSSDMSVYIAAMGGDGTIYCTDIYETQGRGDATAVTETPDWGIAIAGANDPNETFDWSGLVIRLYGRAPLIQSIDDVPYDQGGKVRLVWGRSSHDEPDGSPVITGYAIYRKYDWAETAGRDRVCDGDFPGLGYPPGDWDYVTTVPARHEDVYSTVVPTLCDSSVAHGMCWSFFFVSAVTDEPGFYFDSPPDSGYSVDNLAPSPPADFHMSTATDLAWDEAPEEDFDYFTVYGSMDPDYAGAVFIGYTIGTGLDVSGDRYDYYYVTATDFAGNEGDPSTLENVYAGVPAGIPAAYALWQNDPNPFRAGTSVSFDMPAAGRVTLEVVDVGGRVVRTLLAGNMPEGSHSARWDGRDEAGSEAGPGVYFLRMTAGTFTASRKMMLLR